jgi:protein-S-isoprenylcysteine O-methyltransferase Ste14
MVHDILGLAPIRFTSPFRNQHEFNRPPNSARIMSAIKWVLVIVGVLLLLAGIVFALQGANIIGGSTLMSGDSTYIYVGALVAIVGVILFAVGLRMKGPSAQVPASGK